MHQDPLTSYLARLSEPRVRKNRDYVQLHSALNKFSTARRALRKVLQEPLHDDDARLHIEHQLSALATANGALREALRRCLSRLKLRFALIWGQWALGDKDPHPDNLEHEDPALQMLEMTRRHLETMIDRGDVTYEGSSTNGLVTVQMSRRMEMTGIDLETSRLAEPAYLNLVVEAVNSASGPALSERESLLGSIFQLGDNDPTRVEADTDESQPVDRWLDVLEIIEALTDQLRDRREELAEQAPLDDLEPHLDTVVEDAEEIDELLRQEASSIKSYRTLLDQQMNMPRPGRADLDQIAVLKPLFADETLNDVSELIQFAGAYVAQEVIELVADQLRREEKQRESRQGWRNISEQMQRQVAQVEEKTFTGHSRNGQVTARVSGRVELLAVDLDSPQGDPEAIKAALIEAVNSAIDTASHERGCAMIITPFD